MTNLVKLRDYFILLVTVNFLFQIYIAVIADGEPTKLSSLILIAIAGLSWVFNYRAKKAVIKKAYLSYITHVATFLIVNLSFWIHALARYITTTSAEVDGQLIVSQDWAVYILHMPAIWGIGLLIHTVGTWKTKGFEDVKI